MSDRSLRILVALLVLYGVWGSTYLATRWLVETGVPLLWTASLRFTIASTILFAWAAIRREERPTRGEVGNALIGGVLLFIVSNALVMWGQTRVSSGLTALLIASTPFWLVAMEAAGGQRLHPRHVLGVIVGLLGVGILVDPWSSTMDVGGAIAILLASIAWAIGTLWTKHRPMPASHPIRAASQMVVGAVGQGLLAFAWNDPLPTSIPDGAIGPFLFLTFGGTLVGFSVFSWLLRVTRPAIATTYGYVNPVVAVVLGALFADEVLSARVAVAGVLVLGAVVAISTGRSGPASERGTPRRGPVV